MLSNKMFQRPLGSPSWKWIGITPGAQATSLKHGTIYMHEQLYAQHSLPEKSLT